MDVRSPVISRPISRFVVFDLSLGRPKLFLALPKGSVLIVELLYLCFLKSIYCGAGIEAKSFVFGLVGFFGIQKLSLCNHSWKNAGDLVGFLNSTQ
jgi:hypothetical protein